MGVGSGLLIYKCRRCGKLNKNTHVPNGLTALISIYKFGTTPKEWGVAMAASKSDICFCEDDNLGISDLIGFEKDLI